MAIAKRKDISKLNKNIKTKHFPIKSYENLKPEKIVIPEGCYNLSKEVENIDTQKVLSQVSTYKNGESNSIPEVIAQAVKRNHLFR